MELYAVELKTRCWLQSVAWYRNVLGVRVVIRIPDEEYALLVAGNSRLALMGREQSGTNDRVSLAFDVQDLNLLEERLQQAGTTFRRIHDHSEGLQIINTTDPDGNRINLFQWPHTTE